MGDIYSQATVVIAWIGLEYPECGLAYDLFRRIGQSVEIDWIRIKSSFRTEMDSATQNLLKMNFNVGYDKTLKVSIRKWIGLPWFRRLWTWQEVHLARRIIMACGHLELPWEEFCGAAFHISLQLPQGDKVSFESSEDTAFRKDLRQVRALINENVHYAEGKVQLITLLDITKNALCSDPRDRIYALLSLTEEITRPRIKIDYTRSTVQIYTSVLLEDIRNHRTMRLLRHCESRGQAGTEIPSWVPDWSKPKTSSDMPPTRAPGRSAPEVEVVGDRILIVAGISCATVVYVSPAVLLNVTADEALAVCRSWNPAHSRNSLYQNGDNLLEAYCRTIVCNRIWDQRPSRGTYPRIEEAVYAFVSEEIPTSSLSDDGQKYLRMIGLHMVGRAFFKTSEGHIGVGPTSMKADDRVTAVLGCKTAMVLRPTEGGNHCVVGACYAHGLMDSEALLGQLPSPWRTQWQLLGDGSYAHGYFYVNTESGERTRGDPRLWPLPSEWTTKEDIKEVWYENSVTGEKVGDDPRLTSKALRERGIPVQALELI